MKSSKTLVSILAASMLIAGLAACQKKDEVAMENGPAETAGQKIDQAAATTMQKLDEVGARISQSTANATEEAGKKIERAGEKMQGSAQENK